MLKLDKILYEILNFFMLLSVNLLQVINFTHLNLQIISNSCIFFFVRF